MRAQFRTPRRRGRGAAPSIPGVVGWVGMALLQLAAADALANIPNFGTTAPDTTVSGATTPTKYIDTTSATNYDGLNDVYDGTHGPTNVFPTQTTAANEFWAVVTGSTLTTDFSPNVSTPGSVLQGVRVLHTNFKIAAWSRVYRQEVGPATPNFLNVYDSVLNYGLFYNPIYFYNYFFKMSANGFNSGYTRGTQGAAFNIVSVTGAVIRNAWCDGYPLGLANSSVGYTIEDGYIDRAYRLGEAGQNNGLGTGFAFRLSADDVAGPRIARTMTAPNSVGEDLMQSEPNTGGNGPVGTSFVDCVLLHDCVAQTDEAMHCDVLQTGHGPGNLIFKRVLIQHLLQDKVLANYQGGGRALPQGSAIQVPNGTSGTTYTAAPTFTDVLIATNTNAINIGTFNWSGALTLNRLGIYLKRNQQFSDSTKNNTVKAIQQNSTITTNCTGCRIVYVNPHFTPLGTAGTVDGYFGGTAAANITSGVTFA